MDHIIFSKKHGPTIKKYECDEELEWQGKTWVSSFPIQIICYALI